MRSIRYFMPLVAWLENVDVNCCALVVQVDDILIPRLPLNTETHKFNGWEIVYHKSHILKSVCTNNNQCTKGDPAACELCL